jgi:hypothetical protein
MPLLKQEMYTKSWSENPEKIKEYTAPKKRCECNVREHIMEVQGVPLATEPGISLIILTPMKILQQNLNRSTFVV